MTHCSTFRLLWYRIYEFFSISYETKKKKKKRTSALEIENELKAGGNDKNERSQIYINMLHDLYELHSPKTFDINYNVAG